MTMSKKEKLINTLAMQKQIFEAEGYKVAYICIYGSQNYGLDMFTKEYQSDIDMKAIIVPTLDDLIKDSKPISKTIETEWGQCDLKDIRVYFQTLLKANPAYIETIFTDYYIVDSAFQSEFKEIFDSREELVSTLSAQFIRSMYGMMCEKEKAMCHPYPSIAHKIEKWGYDGKQVHHIFRLWLMMINYFEKNVPLSECFHPNNAEKKVLQDFKLNEFSLDVAKGFVLSTMTIAKQTKDKVLSESDEARLDYSIKHRFIELSQNIIKHKIIYDCGGFVE
jgi:predicted nucleotidyltransferase